MDGSLPGCGCEGGVALAPASCPGGAECGCVACAVGRAASPTWRGGGLVFGAEAAVDLAFVWYWGSEIEPVTTDCGWTLIGWAAPLLDPAPCRGASPRLPWRLAVGSTGTMRMPTGAYRMYFAKARLEHWTDDTARAGDEWPVLDSEGTQKFSRSPSGAELEGADLRTYWRADATGALGFSDLCFSAAYISFLDSADGRHFPLYAPRVTEGGLPAGACTYSRPVVAYGDVATGFRAGWRSTMIPCSGSSPVYRDPTVVYLAGYSIYLMLVVECRSADPSIVDGAGNCNLCTPSDCLGGAVPTTDPVFFACRDPSFQSGVVGPLAFLPSSPDPTAATASFVGVPQVLLTPSGAQLLAHAKAGDWALSGLSICDTAELATALTRFMGRPDLAFTGDAAAAAAARELARGVLAPLFRSLGKLQVSCDLPGIACPPVTVDEHLVFCRDRLHLYFTAKLTCDPALDVPLEVVGHAVAEIDATDVDLAAIFDDGAPPVSGPARTSAAFPESSTTGTVNLGSGPAPGLSIEQQGKPELVWPLGEPITTGNAAAAVVALTRFAVAPCNPVKVTELTAGAPVISNLQGALLDAELNDPDVFEDGTGGYTMVVHSQVLGGTVVMVAPRRVACNPSAAC